MKPPEIRGYRKDQGHTTDKIIRVLNAFYNYLSTTEAGRPFPPEVFNRRKRIIVEMASKSLSKD